MRYDEPTLRDYFACHALHFLARGMITSAENMAATELDERGDVRQEDLDRAARNAYRLADAMLAERSRKTDEPPQP